MNTMIKWQGLEFKPEDVPTILSNILQISEDPVIELVIIQAIQNVE